MNTITRADRHPFPRAASARSSSENRRLPPSLAQRLRKPVSRLAVAGLVPLYFALPRTQSTALAHAALVTGFVAVLIAMLGRLWCALYIAGRKNAELCQDGPYSLVRNPLYVFSFLGAVGIALAGARTGFAPIVAALFLVYYHFVVRAEERQLAELFPGTYAAYCARVPRGLPRLNGYRSRTLLTLDPRFVTRAAREVVWFPIAFIMIAAIGHFA
jgi:protein-S-isoprenylcysteine O-methyltransferase Ste14